MSSSSYRIPNPIETLQKAFNQNVNIRVKRNRNFTGILKSFDIHMNVLLENVTYYYTNEEEGKQTKIEEEFPSVVVRGDNIIFIEYQK
jgi:small nuclear ribonucleoprotein